MTRVPDGISNLEREFELELEDTGDASNDSEAGYDGDSELDEELDDGEVGDEEIANLESGFADRLAELSMAHESGEDVDERLREVVDDMEREYFFKGLARRLSRAGKGLLRKGLRIAGNLPAFKAISGLSQLARGNLKGMLSSLAKSGLQAVASAVPGGAMALPALQSLGVLPGEAADPDWARFNEIAERSFNHLARNLDEATPNPVAAAQQASSALAAGVRGVGAATRFTGGGGGGARRSGRTVRVVLRPGDRLVVTRR